MIAEKFSEFIVTKKTDIDMQKNKFGFFAIWILYKKIEFKICCERGILHYKLEVDNTEIGLHHFDEKMNDVLAFSKENIEYTLNVIKRYINEKRDVMYKGVANLLYRLILMTRIKIKATFGLLSF
ncbi:hypothetical protein [Leadbetterella sp. DM7]|uniref:hypothetical protein n=1 Tax=Leadbetterella sp. DM7 TaxID=3235085 RepID=UPI00349EA3C2